MQSSDFHKVVCLPRVFCLSGILNQSVSGVSCVLEGQPTHIVQQSEELNRIRRMAYLKAIGEASIAGEKGTKLFQDEKEWWQQLPNSKKKAIQKAADKLVALVPDGEAVDTLKYLKLEAKAASEADG